MLQANKIKTTALSWLGTPFHPQATIKGNGADCIGLILGISEELGTESRKGGSILAYYGCDHNPFFDSETLISALPEHFYPMYDVYMGGIALFKVRAGHWHVGVITDVVEGAIEPRGTEWMVKEEGNGLLWEVEQKARRPILRVVHACSIIGKVVEQRVPQRWEVVGMYSFFPCE